MLLINPARLSFRTKVRNPKNKIGSKCQKSLILGTGTLKHHLQAMDSVQDYLGMADKGLSNLEFQEHVLKDLYNYYQYKFNGGEWKNFSLSSSKKYINTITAFDNIGFININKFISNIGSCFDDFQETFSANNSYQKTETKNFDYKWEYMLKILEIPYNKL